MFVTIWIPAGDTGVVRTGHNARVSVTRTETGGGDGDRPITGQVAFVGWQASRDTGLFPVRVRVSNSGGRLWLGMLVSVKISVGEVEGVLAEPNAAVIPSDEGPTVVVVRKGRAVILPVGVGLRRDGLTQVTAKGLQNGDLVVTQGRIQPAARRVGQTPPVATGGV